MSCFVFERKEKEIYMVILFLVSFNRNLIFFRCELDVEKDKGVEYEDLSNLKK